jgi:hypothetical protein
MTIETITKMTIIKRVKIREMMDSTISQIAIRQTVDIRIRLLDSSTKSKHLDKTTRSISNTGRTTTKASSNIQIIIDQGPEISSKKNIRNLGKKVPLKNTILRNLL